MPPTTPRLIERTFAIAAAALWIGAHAARTSVDGIAAVVDGTPILLSEVEEFRQALGAQRPGFAALPPAEQRTTAVERLIDEKVLLAKARQDTTIKVSEQDASTRADEMFARAAEQQGGEKQLELALRQTAGMSLGQFKARLVEQMRDQMMRQKLQMKFVGDVEPSQLQVQDFFRAYADSMPVQKDGVRLSHIQWRVKANAKIDATARAKAEGLIARLDRGESFADLAKSQSEDFSSKDGGDLGYTKRGTLDPDFERGAFALDAGDYTPRPVRTRYGYHIIRVTSKKDNEIRTAHILVKVVPSTEDIARARAFLDSVRLTLKSSADFATAARALSEDKKTREQGGDLGWFQKDQLDPSYKDAVDSLAEGAIGGPLLLGDSWHLFRVDHKAAERKLSLEEDYAQVAAFAKEWLVTQKLGGLVKKWREHVHVENRLAQFRNSEATSGE